MYVDCIMFKCLKALSVLKFNQVQKKNEYLT